MSAIPVGAVGGVVATPDLAEVRETMKGILVDVLSVEPHNVLPDAEFFDDLGGESIEILETQFRVEKRYARRFELGKQFSRGVEATPDGVVTRAYLERLAAEYPFLPLHKLPDSPKVDSLRKLMTVETLVQLVYLQLSTPVAASPAST